MFQKSLDDILQNLDSDLDKFLSDFIDDYPAKIDEIAEELSLSILKHVKTSFYQSRDEDLEIRKNFNSNLEGLWGKAFDLLELCIAIATESGEIFNEEFRETQDDDYMVIDVLTRLHAKGCQVASEVLCLLKSGYADGAHARWRTLHEIAVVAELISHNDKSLAERYLDHESIDAFKAAKLFQENCTNLNMEPIDKNEYEEIMNEKNSLIKKYGNSFYSDYGWAASITGREQPTFRTLEKLAGLSHLRPYYKMACGNVHANSRGLFFRLGLMPFQDNVLLAGSSNLGLAEPGHTTAISLAQLNIFLLNYRPNLDNIVMSKTLTLLEDEIGQAFDSVNKRQLQSYEASVIEED